MSLTNLDGYDVGPFFDEMFEADGSPRPHYRAFAERFTSLKSSELERRKEAIDALFLEQGITFTTYNDNAEGTERIFPFDMVPRIIPDKEWKHLEKGLTQRITALNLFLHDVYHDQKIIKDGVIPPQYLESAKHFRKEFCGFNVPKDIYVHICGTDLIRDDKGQYLVLEDNCRCALQVFLICWKTVQPCVAFSRTFSQKQACAL